VSAKRSRRAPAAFDDAAFAEDMNRAGDNGERIARAARSEYERDGVPLEALMACSEEGRDGTRLVNCVKVYLPRPIGNFGMVFRIERRDGRVLLACAAFGVRHHPRGSNAPTVYKIAHRRLNG
jgi:hypothetical protein